MLATQSPSSPNARRANARLPPSSWTAAPSSSTASLHAQRSPANSVRRGTSSSDQYRIDSQDVELSDLAALRESFLAAPVQSSSRTTLAPSTTRATPASPSKTENKPAKPVDKPAVPEVDPNEPLDPHLRAVYLLAKMIQRSPQVVTDMLQPAVPPVPQPSTTSGPSAPTPTLPNHQVTPITTLMRTKRVHGLMELLSVAESVNTSRLLKEKKLTRESDPRELYADGFFDLAYARWKDVLAGTSTTKPDAKLTPATPKRANTDPAQSSRRPSSETSGSAGSRSTASANVSSPPTSIDGHSPSATMHKNNSVAFPGTPAAEATGTPAVDAAPAVTEEDTTHDLLAKLCAAALRANLPSSALRHATTALESSPFAVRARLYAAAACLDLGRLADAKMHLARLPPDLTDMSFKPKVGRTKDGRTFDKNLPGWVRVRMGVERKRLERLLAERDAVYNAKPDSTGEAHEGDMPLVPTPIPRFVAKLDATAGLLSTVEDHAMCFMKNLLKLTARGYETTLPVKAGDVLCVVPPLACVTVFAPVDPQKLAKPRPIPKSQIRRIIIRGGRRVEPEPEPEPVPVESVVQSTTDSYAQELPLARLATALRAVARGNPELGSALVWAAQRVSQGKSEIARTVAQMGLSEDRACVLALAQSRAVRLAKDVVRTSVEDPKAPSLDTVSGALGIYFPLLSMSSAPSPPPPEPDASKSGSGESDAAGAAAAAPASLIGFASAQISFSGLALVLRATRDMEKGEVVSVDFARVGGVDVPVTTS